MKKDAKLKLLNAAKALKDSVEQDCRTALYKAGEKTPPSIKIYPQGRNGILIRINRWRQEGQILENDVATNAIQRAVRNVLGLQARIWVSFHNNEI